jgi:hypothetical protein
MTRVVQSRKNRLAILPQTLTFKQTFFRSRNLPQERFNSIKPAVGLGNPDSTCVNLPPCGASKESISTL